MATTDALTEQSDLAAILALSNTVNWDSDLTDICNSACRIACERLRVSHSAFIAFDADLSTGTVVAEYPTSVGSVGLCIPLETISQNQIANGHSVDIRSFDVNALPDGGVKRTFEKLHVTSLLIVPVMGKSGMHGSFSVDVIGESRDFSTADRQFCQIFATQVALAIENAKSAQKLAEERLRLLAEAEHGLKTPLLGAIRKAQDSLRRASPSREDVVIMRALCTRMYAQLSTLRIFARLASGEEVRVDLAPLSSTEIVSLIMTAAEDAEALERPNQQNKIVVRAEEAQNALVYADINLFDTTLRNVLDNAIKYSYANRPISISVTFKDSLEIEISNHGLPIKPNELSLVFERGWRSPSAKSITSEGSGLGLWFVAEAMKVVNGSVSIKPRDEMTIVTLRLPLSRHEDPDH